MTEITAPLQSTEFETTPEGTQPAACYGVVLMGTFDGPFGKKKKIRLMFELHGDEKMKDGRPFVASSDFNFSSNEKGGLRLFIEDWRGRKYTNSELKETNGLPISKLIKQPALLNITHDTKDDRTYANIKTIMKPPKGMAEIVLHNDPVIYSVDNHDEVAFQKLSPRLQEKIKTTDEWKIRTGQLPSPFQGEPSTNIPSDFSDEIPF